MERSFMIASTSDISCPWTRSISFLKDNQFKSKSRFRLQCIKKQDRGNVWHADGVLKVPSPLMLGHLGEAYFGETHFGKETVLARKLVRTLLIDNYDSYTYNIYQYLAVINGVPPVVVRNDEWTWEYIWQCLYQERAFDNIVISPGPGSPTCMTDIGVCLKILLECKDIPILGVCLGHQALGYAHGAHIVHAPEPVHGRLSEIEHSGCNLFDGIPSGQNSGFKVVRYHSLVLDLDSLPMELIPIAWTSTGTHPFLESEKSDPLGISESKKGDPPSISPENNGRHQYFKVSEKVQGKKVLMGVMHSTRPHYGVQFHPESVATSYGKKLLENFRNITIDYWLNPSRKHQRKVFPTCHPQEAFPSQKLPIKINSVVNHFSSCTLLEGSHNTTACRSLKLHWRKLKDLASLAGGSRNIFCELFGDQKAEDTFWLDSSETDQGRSRFSFMGGKGGSLWKRIAFRLSDQSAQGGGSMLIDDGQGSVRSMSLKDGFLNFLDQELQSLLCEKDDYRGLPFDFCGGYVGFIGYDMKVECGTAYNHHKSKIPDACFFFADQLVVIDHSNNDVYILSLQNNHPAEYSNGGLPKSHFPSTWLNQTELKLLSLKSRATKTHMREQNRVIPHAASKDAFVIEKSRKQYINDVEKCLNYINDGESYELCLTTRMRKKIENMDPLGLYLNLRERNPAPYAAWLHFANEDICICCSSPERFLRLDQNGLLEAKPIKGTIARGATPEEDRRLLLQLQYSEKDQAENLMIVDLLRNDLGRVCDPGSVHVPSLMKMESYAAVHTLVSTIRGKKRENLTPIECVKAAFPGGSMTGAPKLRSMEILDSVEESSRGIYSGTIGFFSCNQTFDLNIVIRTLVIHGNEISLGAGGAIVALSNPEDEYNEMILKAKAPTATVIECQENSNPCSSISKKDM
ncbi:aminodeoxychorismate synthase, chloroplastic isoform X1 [Amborella trichopoda]|uniref:aminodeoxychorismate synthase n=1 Tax=Amborella trichopoda TaxID=13333 RepID=W1PWD6_AMBTC|nr:aminodeoxychorismate synthase, chloroplastic isoform X1 [Amborella trichopoda]XP_011625729.1 aminodeoxychorismate synthase, chloroplastic isoform X1 [Amborella trichopoda]XP_011625730.1 aminodeoxychorismate synthase, chloroplastic isoform X1 [Amborella trichopoda]ERN12463.1 hypothetical protein AMTR_s00025p00157290 [Amborella trichopoda]|eukprot:XP_006850882.1 aminodeoxychorismate synthase, chloroplastic isoform X1 [Amborella trichopoda]